MFTLGTTSKTICKMEESYALAVGAAATEVLQRGASVKLNADGTVSAIEAATEKPFGVVVAGNREIGEEVTVLTDFKAIVRCEADGAVVTGNELAATGVATTGEKLATYKAAEEGDYVSGIALSDADDTENVMVGVLRGSYPLPTVAP